MRIYIGFDDTDTIDLDRGTGRLARMFEEKLPPGARLAGVIRQQLPKLEGIPYTSHNSSACCIVETEDRGVLGEIIERGTKHIAELFVEGSDPGLCVIAEDSPRSAEIIRFGLTCCRRIVSREEARAAAGDEHLSGHGGTNDGIIGALAGVGLTLYGWSGRFIEYGRLREIPAVIGVAALAEKGILVVGIEHDSVAPAPEDTVDTGGWLRPKLWGRRPVLPVESAGTGAWRVQRGRKGGSAAHSTGSERA